MPNTAAEPSPAPQSIAIGVLISDDGRWLVSRRPAGTAAAGLWEFPGGKVEPGEGVEQALVRELREEIGITPLEWEPLLACPASSGVELTFFRVTAWRGEPTAREGQPLSWITPDAVVDHPMPTANRGAIAALGLPPTYAITPDLPPEALATEAGRDAFLQGLERVAGRYGLVQLRLPRLSEREYCSVARAAIPRVRASGGRLLLNVDPQQAIELGADGIHLNGRRLADLTHRPAGPYGWLAASCHGGEDLHQAERIGVDFAVLGPVQATASHPGNPVLGWSTFAGQVASVPFPVYALGGVTEADIPHARRVGGQGVAGIRAFWPREVEK